jgi:hypothetical protein
MSLVGFEPTTTTFERAKAVHALDRATIVIGSNIAQAMKNIQQYE